MRKKLIAALLMALALILAGCAEGVVENPGGSSGPGIDSRELPRFMVILPESADDFTVRGSEYFLDEIEKYSGAYRFQYDCVFYSDAGELPGILSPENIGGYSWIYLHAQTGDYGDYTEEISDALALASQAGKKTILFGDAPEGFSPDLLICLDFFAMGEDAGGYILGHLSKKSPGKAMKALCFEGNQPWCAEYYGGVEKALDGARELVFMPSGDAYDVTAEYLGAMTPGELELVDCIIGADAASAKRAMEAVLAFTGSIQLRVELVSFVGADGADIENFAYSPINQVTLDIYPTMMIKAAEFVKDFVTGYDLENVRSLKATLIDKENVEQYKLTDEYMLRYKK